HDDALCVACVPSKHKTCSDVIPISDVLSNARQSTVLYDLEDAIETTLLIDLSRIVVAYSDVAILEIMNNSTFKVEKKIRLQKICMGVYHENGRLYVGSGYDTIQVQDLSRTQLKLLKLPSNNVHCITTSKDKIYHRLLKTTNYIVVD
ncbi:Hypothetical predicted protein, partial [Mytilus galloprovincialis]